MEQDDTDPQLIARLEDIKRLKSKVGDRMSNVGKELNIIRNMFKGYENRQKGKNGEQLSKGTQFYEGLCAFDYEQMEQNLKSEIAIVESQINQAKEGREERLTEQLAQMFMQLNGGKIFKVAFNKKNADIKAAEAKEAEEKLKAI